MLRAGFATPLVGRIFLGALAGGLCLMWPSAPAGAQDASTVTVQIPANATVESLFTDFLHYARLGRFQLADAYAEALLAHPDLNPLDVLEVANKDRNAVKTLLIIVENSTIGDSAAKVLALLERGEFLKRQDPERIAVNVKKLGGDPQQEFLATRRLADSGEYAVPAMVAALLDPDMDGLQARILNALTKIGKPAVGPLVVALAVEDNAVRLLLIEALGELGYVQAVPYLRRLSVDPAMPALTREAAQRAFARIEAIAGRPYPGTPEDSFQQLAEKYYGEDGSVGADPRSSEANVWNWDADTQVLVATPVPQRIFGPVMAMRCCEEALLIRNDYAPAIALWLAANIRREARLGLNIESGDPNETSEEDGTRPPAFPRALYFTQAAGPRYAHLVLQRAVRDADVPVALGAIQGLRITAGESSLIGGQDYKQPLVQALRFPDQIVRLRAALALAAARPRTPFADAEFVVPTLARGLTLTDTENVLVVDGDTDNLNRVMDELRQVGFRVIGDRNFYRAMERARTEMPALTAVVCSSDVAEPPLQSAVSHLRAEFAYARTPLLILAKQGQSVLADQVALADPAAAAIEAGADVSLLSKALERVREKTGHKPVNDALAQSIALEVTEVLHGIALDGRTIFDVADAESALVAALAAGTDDLKRSAAFVLAMIGSSSAQTAIADLALNDGGPEPLRISAFTALANSAKRFGNLLGGNHVGDIVSIARDDPDLTMRTAASLALGALNLASNKASEIIRSYHGG